MQVQSQRRTFQGSAEWEVGWWGRGTKQYGSCRLRLRNVCFPQPHRVAPTPTIPTSQVSDWAQACCGADGKRFVSHYVFLNPFSR